MSIFRRFTISAEITSYSDAWQTQSESAAQARGRSIEINTFAPSPTSAALLTTLVAATGAKAVVEVGTGTGISGLAIFDGLDDDGILTTIDADAQHQSAAKAAFTSAGIDSGRARLITGVPGEVLPRLTDAAYDVVVVNDPSAAPVGYFEQALRLLRTGGVVVFARALGEGSKVADLGQRDPHTTGLRELGDAAKAHEGTVTALLPLDDGILVAVKHS
ncbi:MAG: class I SAM-dependent methyltransferase [Candidatus Nanopelagicales bacterium]